MATTYKVLGQINPSATTATTLYTVPSATNTIISTISVCNQADTVGSYRIAVRPAGETLAAKHYIAYDVTLPGDSTDAITIGLTLAATDVVTAYATSANFSFNAYGSEIA